MWTACSQTCGVSDMRVMSSLLVNVTEFRCRSNYMPVSKEYK